MIIQFGRKCKYFFVAIRLSCGIIRIGKGAGAVYKGLELSAAEEFVLRELDGAGTEYVRLTHAAAETMELCRGIGAEYGAAHCKNLLLTDKHGRRFFLLMMEPEKPYRTSEVSRKLGSTRLSFASEEQLMSVLGLTPGSVSVLGLLNPCARAAYREGRLALAVDGELLKRERICVHPNINTATLVMNTGELFDLLQKEGIVPVIADI